MRLVLNTMSPAIGRADDGTNIGCYQGAGVNVLKDIVPPSHTSKSLYCDLILRYSKPCLLLYLRNSGKVLIKIFNIKGALIATPICKQLSSGVYQIPLNTAISLPGTYICRIQSGSDDRAMKIVTLK